VSREFGGPGEPAAHGGPGGPGATGGTVEADSPALTLQPIGYLRSSLGSKVEAARQPQAARGVRGRIELLPGHNFQHALEDLAGWERIWVIFWFHLNPAWRPKVLPPRSRSGRKGVFSTRAPHRPNPLGLSAVRLERVEGLTLHILDVDMVDGTPVLDIKPYVPYTDAHPLARHGWLEDRDPGRQTSGAGGGAAAAAGPPASAADPVDAYDVSFESRAADQAAWIESRTGLAIAERLRAALSLGPAPHPYRRIRTEGNESRIAVKEWRARFALSGRQVRVLEIFSGYRAAQLAANPDEDPIRAHREFNVAWSSRR
jgi:tRNA-Thr(GGU) m(6)t(6)A37 methyltransferase TsaA